MMTEVEFLEMVELHIATMQKDIALRRAGELSLRPLSVRLGYSAKWMGEVADEMKDQIPRKA